MRRTAFLFVLFVAAIGGVALAGCGQEQEQTATPETVVGETTTTETTETETTETDETETETTETETTRRRRRRPPRLRPSKAIRPPARRSSSARRHAAAVTRSPTPARAVPSVPTSTSRSPDDELVLDRVTNGQGGMPSFSSTLSEQQIADVSAYVSSVAGS